MSEKDIVGRKEEIKILAETMRSKEAEFVAIYGRRRVGKTFLIREYFSKKGIYLEVTGVKEAPLKSQLEKFIKGYSSVFFEGEKLKVPHSWDEAFETLTEKIKSLPKRKKVIIFLDEIPWLASKKSGVMQALDYYWNRYWSSQRNFILITCGSAASWMLSNLIHAKGGLYNRITKRILLEPFNLKETQHFLERRSIKLNRKQILDLYMVVGGIPFYLKEFKKGKSTTQNIDDLCFKKSGLLYSEFTDLFRSLFDQSESNLDIIRAIIRSGNTISREKLIEVTKISSGGAINRRLEELEASSFIRGYIPYGKKRRDRFFRVTDEYTLFYLNWIEPLIERGAQRGQGKYWEKISNTSAKSIWSGFAFETVCYKHIDQIGQSLGLNNIAYSTGSWRLIPPKKSKDKGAQIDLLFDREDGVITLCEIKYRDKKYALDKANAKSLDNKKELFEENFPSKSKPTGKQIYIALISTYGMKKNMYSEELIDNEVVLEDLFK
ncbi:MAG: ATP-binding protein [Chlamydiales bacterium]